MGHSIGKWIDETGSGHFDVLEVDTRGPFKGPRAYDSSGLPLHFDNQSTFKERLYLDKNDPNILHDEITVFDHALTRPWGVDKTFQRNPDPHPIWMEQDCNEGNVNIEVAGSRMMYGMSASPEVVGRERQDADQTADPVVRSAMAEESAMTASCWIMNNRTRKPVAGSASSRQTQ
jgi:hypothetical protein